MKILQINSVCGVKSTGRIATDIAACVEERGHICKIAYGRDHHPAFAQSYAYRIGNSFSVRAHALSARLKDGAGLGSKKATEKFLRWVKEYDPDVIHLHNVHGYYLHLPTLFAYLKEAGKKVVWTLHDCWSMTGHCAHFDFLGCDQWLSGCEKCLQKSEYPKSFVDRAAKNYAWKKQMFTGVPNLTIVTPSHWLAGIVKQSFLKEYPVVVIPNGLDFEKFSRTFGDLRERYGLQDKKIVLGVAHPWSIKKGLQDLYRLA
ncbi:MAG: glycosyltransferase, partial [Clostridia bacterium]|nr:glycosyltransferase [Clostridia bacterium]